jgi:hypothetical protein
LFNPKYRIVQQRDTILDKDFFYIERKQYPWSSWQQVVSRCSYSTLTAAMDEVKNLQENKYYESF